MFRIPTKHSSYCLNTYQKLFILFVLEMLDCNYVIMAVGCVVFWGVVLSEGGKNIEMIDNTETNHNM